MSLFGGLFFGFSISGREAGASDKGLGAGATSRPAIVPGITVSLEMPSATETMDFL